MLHIGLSGAWFLMPLFLFRASSRPLDASAPFSSPTFAIAYYLILSSD